MAINDVIDLSSEVDVLGNKELLWLLGYVCFYGIIEKNELKESSNISRKNIDIHVSYLVDSGFIVEVKKLVMASMKGQKFIEKLGGVACAANHKFEVINNFVDKLSRFRSKKTVVSYMCDYIIKVQTNEEIDLLISCLKKHRSGEIELLLQAVLESLKKKKYKIRLLKMDYDTQKYKPVVQIMGDNVIANINNAIVVDIIENHKEFLEEAKGSEEEEVISLEKCNNEFYGVEMMLNTMSEYVNA
jgi:hypothetical protein